MTTANATERPDAAREGLLARYPLVFFFLLSFVFTWGYFWLILAPLNLPGSLMGLGGFGPAASAFLVLAITSGKPGVLRLLPSIVHWRVRDPRRAHHDRCGYHLLAWAVDDPQSTRSATTNRCGTSCAPDILIVPRLAVLLIVAVVALSLPACGNGNGASESSNSEPSSSGAALLPRDVIVPLSTVQEVLPEMTQETSTGSNQTVVGNPTANRAVTYASADGSQRVVISVDKYNSSEEASSAYQEASQKSQEVPGVSGSETVSDLGDGAFIGVVTQGDETHVGGGALYGDLIVTATLQGYDGTEENKAKVTELLRKQGDTAQQTL